MSRVGIGNNITQPDARCMSCKRWKSASKKGFMGFAESGHCSLFRIAKKTRGIKEREVTDKWLI